MTWKASIKATIAGKRVLVLDGGQQPTRLRDLQQYMGRFSTREMLAYIGKVATASGDIDDDIPRIAGTPVPFHCLPYLALLSIEWSNDHRGGAPTDAAFAKAVGMFINLPTPLEGSGDEPAAGVEYLLRLGAQQFSLRGLSVYPLPRTLLIFRDLWPTVAKARSVTPLEVVRKLTGNDLVQNILFGIAFYGASKAGFFRPYTAPPTQGPLRDLLDMTAQGRFLDWVSASYTRIRTFARQVVLDDTFDPHRFNPLIVYPVIRPDLQPPGNGQAYLVPIGRLLWERVSRGLYHNLATYYDAGGGENPFRVAFGYVFQEYVGLLLREALGQERVLPEWRYSTTGGQRDTPDWVVLEGDRAVIVEVKQSSLALDTRKWGDICRFRQDLAKTLGKAAGQLFQFETEIRRGTKGLERLSGVTSFERLVVTWEPVSWGNSLIREEIDLTSQTSQEGQVGHVHVITIDEFERLLGYCWRNSLFDLLQRKRLGPDGQDAMDFFDWMVLHLKGSGPAPANPFLMRTLNGFLEASGLSTLKPFHQTPAP
jgi:hypothetical protein